MAVVPTNYRGLAFLLSIGSLPFACTKDNDDTDSGGTTTPGTTTPGTTTPGTTPTGTTGTGTESTDPTTGSSMSSDPTTTGNSAGGTTTTTGPLDTSTTEPEPTTFLTTNTETGFETDEPPPPMPTDPTDPICIAYGQHVVECLPRYAAYQDDIARGCEYNKAYALRTDGQACMDAMDAMYVCLSKVDCAEFMDPEIPPPSCANEIAAIEMACPNSGG